MGLLNTVKGYFGAKRTEDPVKKFSHINVRTNSLVTLDETFFLLNDQYTILENPGTTLQVTDIGVFTVMGMKTFRFYMESIDKEGEAFIQVIEDSHELMLFRPIDEIYPQCMEEWSHWKDLLKDPTFVMDSGIEYEQTWSRAVETRESVHPDASQKDHEPYDYPVTCKLYERTIDNGTPFKEYIMVCIEDEERVNIYAGVDINSAGVNFS